jgi:hypothetical protein
MLSSSHTHLLSVESNENYRENNNNSYGEKQVSLQQTVDRYIFDETRIVLDTVHHHVNTSSTTSSLSTEQFTHVVYCKHKYESDTPRCNSRYRQDEKEEPFSYTWKPHGCQLKDFTLDDFTQQVHENFLDLNTHHQHRHHQHQHGEEEGGGAKGKRKNGKTSAITGKKEAEEAITSSNTIEMTFIGDSTMNYMCRIWVTLLSLHTYTLIDFNTFTFEKNTFRDNVRSNFTFISPINNNTLIIQCLNKEYDPSVFGQVKYLGKEYESEMKLKKEFNNNKWAFETNQQ